MMRVFDGILKQTWGITRFSVLIAATGGSYWSIDRRAREGNKLKFELELPNVIRM
jgi:hypothetical protein